MYYRVAVASYLQPWFLDLNLFEVKEERQNGKGKDDHEAPLGDSVGQMPVVARPTWIPVQQVSYVPT